jgi:hypothetical protein
MMTFYSILHSHLFLKELIASWNNLLNWSENAAVARRLQEEIIMQKQLLDSIAIDRGESLESEEAIREKIHELNVSVNRHDRVWKFLFLPIVKFHPEMGKPEISFSD